MTPALLARLHAAAFAEARAWSEDEFARLLASPACFALTRPADSRADSPAGFALGQVVADEAELLTLAVIPAARRGGLGRALLAGFEATARARGATHAFLEVAADNGPALALYQGAGWRESGRRPGYYPRPHGPACDAIVLKKRLT